MKQHRVGTLTLGIMLITFGLLFLARIFFPELSYEFIYKMWPIIFIFLGIEILITTFRDKSSEKLIYDKTAIVLIVFLSFFAMGMAIADVAIQEAHLHAVLID